MKIGILQTGKTRKEIFPRYGSYGKMFIEAINAKEKLFDFVIFEVCDDKFPLDCNQCDGWIITGSKHSAYEQLEWIAKLKKLIIDIVAAKKPLLGVCFGHQIIASALGGVVEKSDKGWGVGLDTYTLKNKPSYASNLDNELTLNIVHQDQVTLLPKGAVVYASSDFCDYAGFYIDDIVLTIQAHPEFSTDFNKSLIGIHSKSTFTRELTNKALDEIAQNANKVNSREFATTISNFFLQ